MGPFFSYAGALSGTLFFTLSGLLIPAAPEKQRAFPGRSSARMLQAI